MFPFSLAVAAHAVLQAVGTISGGSRIGGVGPQHYAAYPGEMTVQPTTDCEPDCEIGPLTGSALQLDVVLPQPAPAMNDPTPEGGRV